MFGMIPGSGGGSWSAGLSRRSPMDFEGARGARVCKRNDHEHVHLLADLSGWLGGQGLDAGVLTGEKAAGFLQDGRGHRTGVSPRRSPRSWDTCGPWAPRRPRRGGPGRAAGSAAQPLPGVLVG